MHFHGYRTQAFQILSIIIIVFFTRPAITRADLYTLNTAVNLRTGPGLNYKVLRTLSHNQTLILIHRQKDWVQIKTLSGLKGYIHHSLVSDRHIRIYKKERKLFLIQGDAVLKVYDIALCPFNPGKDKIKQGDGGTPEGRFFICEMLRKPGKKKYGARSMRLSYPNIEDARRGLAQKFITHSIYWRIVKKIRSARMPDQTTQLGGSIRIHGGGSDGDWTLGCVALKDGDVIDLFDRVNYGTRVDVYVSKIRAAQIDRPGYLNQLILAGAKKELQKAALYTTEASRLIKMSYPMGDISADQAVCTDIVVRALRHAGLDLQALVHEDIRRYPKIYRRWIKTPDFNIDHRRTRILYRYLSSHAENLTGAGSRRHFDKKKTRPGDIVIMDTGIRNGTIFDHIGIVDDQLDDQDNYKVINIWTTGLRTDAMSLLGHHYPTIVGHFRMTHPFDYQ